METNDVLLDRFIRQGLAEDVGEGDHTSMACIRSTRVSKAKLLVKDDGIISGIRVAEKIFREVAPAADIDILLYDGTLVKPGDIAFYVTCPTRALLIGERLALNTMQHMSGISTMAYLFVQEVEGLPVKILDTRKTTPGIRFLEKEAVRLGGGHNYRDGLYDWIMIKDNHIEACGSIPLAIDRVQAYLKKINKTLNITVEVRNLVELQQVLDHGGVTRIMMDNFEIPILKEAVAIIGSRFETEASGGITLHNVRAYAETGVNYISSGALTHSAGTLDMSLKIIYSEG
ncbi:MAG TPA: carboxylating nicotinate-nucleotide diphosphorylase [Saprospiraceae bacterium]|nr:carboxylating nicotinate-nucleotide diphosphorylase [Saprospiraceae bacterium]